MFELSNNKQEIDEQGRMILTCGECGREYELKDALTNQECRYCDTLLWDIQNDNYDEVTA